MLFVTLSANNKILIGMETGWGMEMDRGGDGLGERDGLGREMGWGGRRLMSCGRDTHC